MPEVRAVDGLHARPAWEPAAWAAHVQEAGVRAAVVRARRVEAERRRGLRVSFGFAFLLT